MSESMNVGVVVPKSTSSCFVWEIKNFCMGCKVVGSSLVSPEFTTSFSTVSKWKIEVYPAGFKEESRDYIGLFIYNVSTENISAHITFSLLDDKNDKTSTFAMGERIVHPNRGYGSTEFAQKEIIKRDENRLLVKDTLKILCEIDFSDPGCAFKKLELKDTNNQCAPRLKEFDDFEKLLESGNFKDVIIIVGETQFQAHKAILTSRSTVFEAMFKHDMKEKEENTIEITDIKPEVMKEVLRFMYAGKVNDIEKFSNELLMAAEKYSIIGLKQLCVKIMIKNLKIENAVDFLKFADMCNATDLKSRAIDFIVVNQKAVAGKPEFELVTCLDSKVQLELMRAIIAKNSPQ